MSSAEALTVVVPLYNGERFIGATLDSLADQTVPLHAVVVVDDGSTDGGAGIARAHPIGAQVLSYANAGVAVSRNRGALAAQTRFIAFLDQDDLWMRRRHERILAYLEANVDCRALATTEASFYLQEDGDALRDMGEALHHGARMVPAGSDLVALRSLSDSVTEPAVVDAIVTTRRLLESGIGVTCSFIVERDLFFEAGGCPASVRTMDDWLAMLNISRLCPITLLDEPSVLYRVHPHSATMTAEWPLAFLTSVTAARYGGTLVPPGHARDPREVTLSLFWRHWLLELSRRDRGGLLDALALLRLLANTDESWVAEAARLFRTAASTRVRRFIRAWRGQTG